MEDKDEILRQVFIDFMYNFNISTTADKAIKEATKAINEIVQQKILEARIEEVDWFIGVWNKTVNDSSYSTHTILEKRLKAHTLKIPNSRDISYD